MLSESEAHRRYSPPMTLNVAAAIVARCPTYCAGGVGVQPVTPASFDPSRSRYTVLVGCHSLTISGSSDRDEYGDRRTPPLPIQAAAAARDRDTHNHRYSSFSVHVLGGRGYRHIHTWGKGGSQQSLYAPMANCRIPSSYKTTAVRGVLASSALHYKWCRRVCTVATCIFRLLYSGNP